MGSIDIPSPDSTPAEMEAVNMPTLSADGVTADCDTRSDRNDDHDGRSDDPATATTTGGIKSDAADGDDDGSTITESNHT